MPRAAGSKRVYKDKGEDGPWKPVVFVDEHGTRWTTSSWTKSDRSAGETYGPGHPLTPKFIVEAREGGFPAEGAQGEAAEGAEGVEAVEARSAPEAVNGVTR